MMGKEKKQKEPKYIPSPLNTPMINYKVYYMSKLEYTTLFVLVFVVGGIVGLIFYGGLFKYDGNATIATYISDVIIFGGIGFIAFKIFFPIINSMLLE